MERVRGRGVTNPFFSSTELGDDPKTEPGPTSKLAGRQPNNWWAQARRMGSGIPETRSKGFNTEVSGQVPELYSSFFFGRSVLLLTWTLAVRSRSHGCGRNHQLHEPRQAVVVSHHPAVEVIQTISSSAIPS